jgi:hypothetical protein
VWLRDGHVTPGTLAVLLQVPVGEAEEALDAVAEIAAPSTTPTHFPVSR